MIAKLHYDTPIPRVADQLDGWQAIPVHESGEELVAISGNVIAVEPVYDTAAKGQLFARRSTVRRLKAAANLLPPSLQLVVLDAYRSLESQRRLYNQYFDAFARDSKQTNAELHRLTEQYVRLPNDSDDAPSPHLTGGAVDVTVRHRTSGEYLDFGTQHDDMCDASWLRYFEDKASLSPSELRARNNRRVLYAVMTNAGFVGYAYEWWHFNAPETQMGALVCGRDSATFGARRLPD